MFDPSLESGQSLPSYLSSQARARTYLSLIGLRPNYSMSLNAQKNVVVNFCEGAMELIRAEEPNTIRLKLSPGLWTRAQIIPALGH